MIKHLLIFLLMVFIIQSNAISVEFSELRFAGQPSGRSEYTSASDENNNLIIYSGLKSTFPDFILHNDIYVYEYKLSRWVRHNDSPSEYARREASGVFWGNSLYVFGGSDYKFDYTNTIYKYDFSTKMWSEIIPSSGSIKARYKHAAAVTKDGKMYVYGGNDGQGFIGGLSYFDIPNNKWVTVSQKGTIPQERSLLSLSVFTENNEEKINLFGGLFSYNAGFRGYCSPDLFVFDPKTSTWTNRSPASALSPEKRTGQCVSVFGDKYFVFGGYSDKFLSDSHFWTSTTNTWSGNVLSKGPFFPLGLYGAGMSCAPESSGHVVCYVFGGVNGNYTEGYLDNLFQLNISF